MAAKLDDLISELSEEERKNMFRDLMDERYSYDQKDASLKLKNNVSLLRNKNKNERSSLSPAGKRKQVIESVYKKMSFLEKIIIFFTSFFSSKSVEKIVEETIFSDMAKKIAMKGEGLISFKDEKIKNDIYVGALSVADNISVFRESVKYIYEKKLFDFFYYIFRMEMPDFEASLMKNIDPDNFVSGRSGIDFKKLEMDMRKKFNETVRTLDEKKMDFLFGCVKDFTIIQRLLKFPFEAFLGKFDFSVKGKMEAPISSVKKYISDLYDLFYNIDAASVNALIKYIFSYYLGYCLQESEEKREHHLKDLYKKAFDSVGAMDKFLSLPLENIVKYINRDFIYSPDEIICSDDWLKYIEQRWQNMMNEKFNRYMFSEKKEELISRFSVILKIEPDYFKNEFIYTDKHENQYVLSYMKIFSMINIFFRKYYSVKATSVMENFILNGKFYKEINKKDLSNSYNYFARAGCGYDDLLLSLRAGGSVDAKVAAAYSDITSPAIRLGQIKKIIDACNQDICDLAEKYIQNLGVIVRSFRGILEGDSGLEYDTLSNLEELYPKVSLVPGGFIYNIYMMLKTVWDILNEYFTIEKRCLKV